MLRMWTSSMTCRQSCDPASCSMCFICSWLVDDVVELAFVLARQFREEVGDSRIESARVDTEVDGEGGVVCDDIGSARREGEDEEEKEEDA